MFQSVCKIGTGFSDEVLKTFTAKFKEEGMSLPEGAPMPKNYMMGDCESLPPTPHRPPFLCPFAPRCEGSD